MRLRPGWRATVCRQLARLGGHGCLLCSRLGGVSRRVQGGGQPPLCFGPVGEGHLLDGAALELFQFLGLQATGRHRHAAGLHNDCADGAAHVFIDVCLQAVIGIACNIFWGEPM